MEEKQNQPDEALTMNGTDKMDVDEKKSEDKKDQNESDKKEEL